MSIWIGSMLVDVQSSQTLAIEGRLTPPMVWRMRCSSQDTRVNLATHRRNRPFWLSVRMVRQAR
jgi:hypothetical protein